MMISKSRRDYRSRSLLLVGALVWTLCFPHGVSAQQRLQRGSASTIDAGTPITVVTSEAINANDSDGRIYTGVVSKDVVNRNGNVAIPRGSNVGLVVRKTSDNEVALDLDSVTMNQQQYSIEAESSTLSVEDRDGIGANKRTGEFLGGGALIGAVVGAIAGGKKGALIGGGVGAAAGAGTQVLTRGRSVSVPVETELTFRMEQPLRLGNAANRASQSSRQVEPVTSAAYREGLRAGRSDWDRSLPRNTQTTRWTGQDRRDYEAGYARGFQLDEANGSARPIREQAFIRIGADNNISWQAPANARVTLKVDNNPVQRFASGQSGTQVARITSGHVYLFTLTDVNGNEMASDRLDTRGRR